MPILVYRVAPHADVTQPGTGAAVSISEYAARDLRVLIPERSGRLDAGALAVLKRLSELGGEGADIRMVIEAIELHGAVEVSWI